jgi:hypothetical protein
VTQRILNEGGGRIAFQFHARDLNLVMGPSSQGASIPFRVFLEGELAGDAHGSDVDPGAQQNPVTSPDAHASRPIQCAD